jgi:sec-independent protein translocase protein TatA
VVVVLFGRQRLPEAARGLGRSMRIFKSEINEMKSDGKATSSTATRDGDDPNRDEHEHA